MDLSFQKKLLSQRFARSPTQAEFTFLGFASDEGTARNNGRVGGQKCVSMLRKELATNIRTESKCTVADLGDVVRDEHPDLQRTLQALRQRMLQGIKDYPKAKYIVVGGSNDQSYCNASAMIEGLGGRIGVINIDAHLDVRPLKEGKAHSGSPFRLLLEDERFKGKFVEFGAKGYCCSKKHADYVLDKGGQIVWMERDIRRARIEPGLSQAGSCFRTLLNSLTKEVDWVFVSFDIDSIDCGSMPGVSAPNTTGGLQAGEAEEIVRLAGECDRVRMVDFSEGNPAVEWRQSMQLLGRLVRAFVEAV